MRNIKLLMMLISLLASCKHKSTKLPVYGQREAVEKVVDGKTVTDTVYSTIPSFKFLNQDSVAIDEHFFDNKIYIADFFFTSCPSICPIMHRNLLEVYEQYKGNKEVLFLSHSIDFKYDYPHVLKKYAKKLGITGDQWQFVHGSREEVYTLAQNNYLVAVNEDPKARGGYVHQGYLVLVDKQKRVRGAYDGTKKSEVERLTGDLETLMEEK